MFSLNEEQLMRIDCKLKFESTKCIVMAMKLSLLRDVQQSVVKHTCFASCTINSLTSLNRFSYKARIYCLEIEWRLGSV